MPIEVIEYLPDFKPDLIIFYGGFNETIQNAVFDPRPGFPYNFFYRSGTGPLSKLLLQNSAIIGEFDKKNGKTQLKIWIIDQAAACGMSFATGAI